MRMALESSTTRPHVDDLDSYDVDLEDDPFRSPSPRPNESRSQDDQNSLKRKSDGLGIDEEVDVTKRARVPRVKLDEARLLSDDGIPKLRKRARDLRFKGKGHEVRTKQERETPQNPRDSKQRLAEGSQIRARIAADFHGQFSDASRLLTFYQFWLDDLFPKAKFLDALAMVEKAGHKRSLATKRVDWINETKPNRVSVMADGGDADEHDDGDGDVSALPDSTSTAAPTTHPVRNRTPQPTAGPGKASGDVPDDEDDVFGATPIRPKTAGTNQAAAPNPVDDEDDLDALMAEAERGERMREGQGSFESKLRSQGPEDEDDLDALMAGAEADERRKGASAQPRRNEEVPQENVFADDEAAMAEMGGLWD